MHFFLSILFLLVLQLLLSLYIALLYLYSPTIVV
nr:MAG TPA: hypothetical protein [Bacteriophage sp.]